MINSLTAAYLGVPVRLVTGDKGLCAQGENAVGQVARAVPGQTDVHGPAGVAILGGHGARGQKRLRLPDDEPRQGGQRIELSGGTHQGIAACVRAGIVHAGMDDFHAA